MDDTDVDTKVRRRVEVTAVVRRRRWRDEEKGRIVAEAVRPGAVIAEVARRHGLMPQHLSNWIRAAKDGHFALPGEVAFVPVVTTEPPASRERDKAPPVEIAIGRFVVRVATGTDAGTLDAILHSLKRAAA